MKSYLLALLSLFLPDTGIAQDKASIEKFSSAVSLAMVDDVEKLLAKESALAVAVDEEGWPMFLLQPPDFVPEIFYLLLENGADPRSRNSEGNTMLHTTSDSAYIAPLLAAGADLEARNDLGWTPLITAATDFTNGPDYLYALLEVGANPHAKDNRGWTAESYLSRVDDETDVEPLRILRRYMAYHHP